MIPPESRSPMSLAAAQTRREPPIVDRPLRASVIVVNYNAGERLVHCLQSLEESLPARVEIILVDNASRDQTGPVIQRDFPRVVFVESDTNLGFGGGCNLGAKQARGEYLVFLNPDTTVERGWLEALLSPMAADPGLGLVTSRIVLAGDPERLNTAGNKVHLTGLTLCRGLGESRDAFGVPGEVAAVSGAAFSIRRELFESLGGFDEDMFLYMEDTDLSWRARLAGWRVFYSPTSVVRHHYELKVTPEKVFYQERNRYLMLLKTLRMPTLMMLLPAFALAELITWTFVLLKDRSNIGNKIRAYKWVFANWGRIMEKRQAVQASRSIRDRDLLRDTEFRLDLKQASPGFASFAGDFVFNPVFFVLRSVILLFLWW
jgi:GT2 family glycosyltransferase